MMVQMGDITIQDEAVVEPRNKVLRFTRDWLKVGTISGTALIIVLCFK